MIIWICTDMEGLAGIDEWDQCYDPDDESPKYQYGREQLTAEVNAAVAGCFDAGATEVRVIDGHGRNQNRGFIAEKLDPRVNKVWMNPEPVRLQGLDESVSALAIIGQHAMAGTINGFLDHTQMPKQLCRFLINGEEHGEMSEFALYGGHFGIPLVYASGDEALGAEVNRLFPAAKFTPTKRGTGWETCELYPPDEVRQQIRTDIAAALHSIDPATAWKVEPPITVTVEWAWSAWADQFRGIPGVERIDARTVSWKIGDARDIYSFPSANWHPLA